MDSFSSLNASSSTKRQQLQRTGSTVSLPTPPRTIHKKRGRVAFESSDDEHRRKESEDDGGGLIERRKKRRMLDAIAEELAEESQTEEAFWMGSPVKKQGNAKGKRRMVSAEPPSTIERARIQAPLSPPPSRRQTRSQARAGSEPPITPLARRVAAGLLKSRPADAPRTPATPVDNPFLDDDAEASPSSSPIQPRTPADWEEQKKITYVFRGKKAVFDNPNYNISPSARARSLLPPEHPEFSPLPTCPPRLLFPAKKTRSRASAAAGNPYPEPSQRKTRAAAASSRLRTPTGWETTDDEGSDDEGDLKVKGKKLNFGAPKTPGPASNNIGEGRLTPIREERGSDTEPEERHLRRSPRKNKGQRSPERMERAVPAAKEEIRATRKSAATSKRAAARR